MNSLTGFENERQIGGRWDLGWQKIRWDHRCLRSRGVTPLERKIWNYTALAHLRMAFAFRFIIEKLEVLNCTENFIQKYNRAVSEDSNEDLSFVWRNCTYFWANQQSQCIYIQLFVR